jgi:hypothetical protein
VPDPDIVVFTLVMRTWTILAVVLCTVLVCAQAGDAGWAGSWTGTWDDGGGNSGGMKLKLAKTDGKWTAEAGFDIGGQDVPSKITSVKIDGDSITFAYDWDFQGASVTSTLTGKRKDRANDRYMEGTYKSAAGDQAVSAGTWKLSAK